MVPAEGTKLLLLVAPSALRPVAERIHDVATTIQADVPETATKVLVLYPRQQRICARRVTGA